MQNNLMNLNFNDNQVRIVMVDDEPHWVLADLCRGVGIANPGNVAARLPKDTISSVRIADTQYNVVNEKGLYAVIFKSEKPDAVKFQDWVLGVVLPTIRKTGSFSINQNVPSCTIVDDEKRVFRWLEERKEHMKQLEQANKSLYAAEERINEQMPYVRQAQDLISSDGLLSMQQTANILGYGRQTLFNILRQRGIFPEHGTMPYRNYIDLGYFKVKVTYIKIKNIEVAQTFVTGKGLTYLYQLLNLNMSLLGKPTYANITNITGYTGIQADTTFYQIDNIQKQNDKRLMDKRKSIEEDDYKMEDLLKGLEL